MNAPDQPIRQVLDNDKAAVLAKDVDAFVALYDRDVLVFDMWRVWSYDGIAAWHCARFQGRCEGEQNENGPHCLRAISGRGRRVETTGIPTSERFEAQRRFISSIAYWAAWPCSDEPFATPPTAAFSAATRASAA